MSWQTGRQAVVQGPSHQQNQQLLLGLVAPWMPFLPLTNHSQNSK
jgi:hypothetical protein